MRKLGTQVIFLLGLFGYSSFLLGNDAEIRKLGREVVAEGAMEDLEAAREAIARDIQETRQRIAKLQKDLRSARRNNPKLNNQRTQLLERLIKEEQTNLPTRINQHIAQQRPPVRRLLAAARRVNQAGFLSVVSFYTADAIGALDALSNRNTKFGAMYYQALRGNCAWLLARANNTHWNTQLELELLERGVKTAPIIVEQFVARIRQSCR